MHGGAAVGGQFAVEVCLNVAEHPALCDRFTHRSSEPVGTADHSDAGAGARRRDRDVVTGWVEWGIPGPGSLSSGVRGGV